MEVVETIITIIQVVEVLIRLIDVVDAGINRIEKTVDDFGRVVTTFKRVFDSNGDGSFDSEEILLTLPQTIPKLYDEYCIVNDGDTIGLGQPALKLVDASDLLPSFSESDIISSDGEGFVIDFDNDGAFDDIFYPAPFDFTGDGVNDFYQIVDADDNGLPDLSPFSPFYPVGSDGYREIVSRVSTEEYTIMNKPLKDYTVTEGILLIFLIACSFKFLSKLFRRKKVVTIG